MKQVNKRIISFILSLIFFIGSGIFSRVNPSERVEAAPEDLKTIATDKNGNPIKVSVGPTSFGSFKNVTHTISLDPGYDQLCKRSITGEIIFDWPESSTYVDVVFIQDFSDSFDGTIVKVGETVKNIISSLNFGKDASGYPKDRAMIVGFKGLEGLAKQNYMTGYTTYSPSTSTYKVESSPLIDSQNGLDTWIKDRYNATYANSGTPTVDGMVEAEKAYKSATPSSLLYNAPTYQTADGVKTRKTVYILITDGAANTAKWENLTKAAQDMIKKTGFNPPQYSNISYVWTDDNYGSDPKIGSKGTVYNTYTSGVPSYSRREKYEVMLQAEKDIATMMKSTGGIGGKNSTFVTAFWEDYNSLKSYSGGYGNRWDEMRVDIKAALVDMAGDEKRYVTSQNIDTFTKTLTETFRKSTTPVIHNITFTPTFGVDMVSGNFTLQKKDASGTWVNINAGSQTTSDLQKLFVDFSDLKVGTYKITYHMIEAEFKSYTETNKTYNPVTVSATFEGKETPLGTIATGDLPLLTNNTKTNCDISVNKIITESKADYDAGGTKYKELDKRKTPFYFSSSYNFTDKLQDVKGSLVLKDTIDPRLEILDAFIVADNDPAKADVITGATPNNTLIATKDKGTPTLKIEGNTVSYTMPQKPVIIEGTNFPYGGYVGKTYVLVVKVKIRDDVTDAQVDTMREPIGGNETGMKGIPNTSEILIDDNPTLSNTVRAVPPAFQEPNIYKQIQKIQADAYWSDKLAPLDSSDEIYKYRIRLEMPYDTSSYENLIIQDTLNESIEKSDTENVIVYYINPDTDERTDIASDKYVLNYDSASVNHNLKVTITDQTLLNSLSEKDLYVEFPVKIKKDADLSKNYNDISKAIEIKNIANYSINTTHIKESNPVTAILFTPSVTLKKFNDLDPKSPLLGAEFTITDNGNTNSAVTLITDANGEVVFGNLIPGHTYTIIETKAPTGYLPSANTWTVELSKTNVLTVKDNGGNIVTSPFEVINKSPETPQPTKYLKGSDSTDIFKTYSGGEGDPSYKLRHLNEEVTYKIEVPIVSTEAFTKVTFYDKVDPLLVADPDSLKVYTVDRQNGNATKEVPGIGGIKNGEITYSIKDNLGELANKTLVLEFKAKVGVTLKEVFEKYNDGVIPNKADFAVNGRVKTTNESKIQATKVLPPPEKPELDKKVNGADEITIENISEKLTYTMEIKVPESTKGFTKILLEDTFLPIFKLGTVDEMLVTVHDGHDINNDPVNTLLSDEAKKALTISGQTVRLNIVGETECNKYQGKSIVVTVPATIDETKNLADYLELGLLPNTARLSYNNNANDDIEDKAKVTPPGEDPTPKKDVNGKDSLVLGSLEQLFTYHVTATVPSDITNFTKYVLSDNLENVLVTSQGQVKVKVDGLDNSELTSLVKVTDDGLVTNNIVTLDIPMTTLDKYKGKNIEISIEARIKEGVTAEELAVYMTQDQVTSIPNTANLALTDNTDEDKKSNTVPVTPPDGDTPDISKTVNDVSEYQLTDIKEVHTYKVTSNIPENITGYKKVVIADKLENILEATSVKVLVDGVEQNADEIATYGSLVNTNGDISYTIDKNFDKLAGKAVQIVIEAKVKDAATEAELKPYLNQGFIPNKATLTFNDGPTKEAEVKVLPPSGVPTLDKKVNGEDEITITNLTDNLTYTMDIVVPENTRDITKIVLEDTFLPIFKLGTIDQVLVSVTKNGVEDATLEGEAKANLSVEGQKVSLSIVGASQANKFAGTTIKVTVPATIDGTKNLEDYLVAGSIPNTAKLSYNNDPNKDIEDTAKVTPPGENPSPVKDVDGKPSLVLGSLDQVFTYHVMARVPSDVSKFTKYVLTDDLEDILRVIGTPVVKVNGVKDDVLTNKVVVTDENIVTLDMFDVLSSYVGKNIEISIEARIKDGVTNEELGKYIDNQIPNKANLKVSDKPEDSYDTNVVPVTPPGEVPTPVKDVNGKAEETLTNITDVFTYNIRTVMPNDLSTYEKVSLVDDLEDVLEVVSAVVEIDGVVSTAYTPTVDTQTSYVKVDIVDNVKELKGKEVNLKIEARIKEGADLTGYVNGKVPNKATLIVNDDPTKTHDTNVVPVTPPGEVPTPVKDVNGKAEETLTNITDVFTYNIRTVMPNDLSTYEKVSLVDDLEDVLEVVSAVVEIDGVVSTAYTPTVDTQTSYVKVDIVDNVKELKGKEVNLKIEARIKEGADLTGYVNGKVPNKATLIVNDDPTKTHDTNVVPVTPPVEVPEIPEEPGILLVKKADTSLITEVGQVVTYSFTIINTGNTVLNNVTLVDPMLGGNIALPKTTLAVGEIMYAKATYTVTEEDLKKVEIPNTATVTGDSPKGTPVKDDDDENIPVKKEETSGIDLDKSADRIVVESVGEVVNYRFIIRNTGNVKLSNIVLNDPMLGGSITLAKTELEVGEYMVVDVAHTVTEEDLNKAVLTNLATVEGTTPSGGKETDEDHWKIVPRKPITASFNILKSDYLEGKGLAGAKFYLVNSNNQLVRDLISDKDGLLKVENLPVGVYVLYEYEAPEGYNLNPAQYRIIVSPSGLVTMNGSTENFVVPNIKKTPATNSVVLHKLDEVTGQVLKGAKFKLYFKSNEESTTTVIPVTEEVTSTVPSVDTSAIDKLINDKYAEIEANLKLYDEEVKAREILIADYNTKVEEYNKKVEAMANETTSESTDATATLTPPEALDLTEIDAKILEIYDKSTALNKEYEELLAQRKDLLNTTVEVTEETIATQIDSTEGQANTEAKPANVNEFGYTEIGEYLTNDYGLIVISELPEGDYYFEEVEAPAGYDKHEGQYTFSVVKGEVSEIILNVVNKPKEVLPVETEVVVQKNWVNAPEEVPYVIFLLKDSSGRIVDSKYLEQGMSEVRFTHLPIVDEKNQPITYTVEEVMSKTEDSEGKYESKVEIASNEGGYLYVFTNTYTKNPPVVVEENIDITVFKSWCNAEGLQVPDVTFILYKEDVEYARQVLKSGSDTLVFKDLPKYDENGKEINWYVGEAPYESDVFINADHSGKAQLANSGSVTFKNIYNPNKPGPSPNPVPRPGAPSLPSSPGGPKPILPNTGNTTSTLPIVSGLILIGIAIYLQRKRKINND